MIFSFWFDTAYTTGRIVTLTILDLFVWTAKPLEASFQPKFLILGGALDFQMRSQLLLFIVSCELELADGELDLHSRAKWYALNREDTIFVRMSCKGVFSKDTRNSDF
jgi:hypothetical protein